MGRSKIEGISEFLAGVADLMKDERLTFECLLAEDQEHVTLNFHSDIHEYSLGWEPWHEGGVLSLKVWNGTGERTLVSGPLDGSTWESIKVAIGKEDVQCDGDSEHPG
jgi:hypothetical protein